MFGMTIADAAAVCGGSVHGKGNYNTELTSVIIDSRIAAPGALFIAYRGEKADGHDYIASAFEKGASCALAEYVPENAYGPVIVCNDVQEALEKIMAAFREKITVPVLGITGSVGKTTGKEMVSAVLAQKYCVHKTSGNFNNTIGVPITLGGVMREHEAAVIEMGINHFGEMSHLGAMVKPDLMLYTRIGHAHLEFLQDLSGVFQAKTEVLPFMKEDAPVIYNGDDPYQAPLGQRVNSVSYGRGENCDVRAADVAVDEKGCISCRISYINRSFPVRLNAFGEHMLSAALEGAAAGFALGLSDEEIVAGIASYQTVGRRFAFEDTGSVRLIDDCYNANPDSVMSSVTSLMDLGGRHVCILGDMLELGHNTEQMHREVGRFAKEKGVECLIACGELCRHTAEGFGAGALYFEDKQAMMAALPALIQKEDAVLVKASLRSNFAEVSEAIKKL